MQSKEELRYNGLLSAKDADMYSAANNIHPIRVNLPCSREYLVSEESKPHTRPCGDANLPQFE